MKGLRLARKSKEGGGSTVLNRDREPTPGAEGEEGRGDIGLTVSCKVLGPPPPPPPAPPCRLDLEFDLDAARDAARDTAREGEREREREGDAERCVAARADWLPDASVAAAWL